MHKGGHDCVSTHNNTIHLGINLSKFKNSSIVGTEHEPIEEATIVACLTTTPEYANVLSDLLSTENDGSGCGKHLGIHHRNHQSDFQGYFADSIILDGKLSGLNH